MTQSLNQKLSERISVKDFGATGNGATDDTAAIQAALTAAYNAGGGEVYVPKGTYIWSAPLGIGNNVTLCGAGPSSIIKVKNNAGGYSYMLGYNAATGNHDITVRDLRFDQNTANNTTPVPPTGGSKIVLNFQNTKNVLVENCIFDSLTGVWAVHVFSTLAGSKSSDAKVLNCRFIFTPTAGANYDNTAVYLNCAYNYVVGNYFEDTTNDLARGAIESHKGPGRIIGNTSNGYTALCRIVPDDVVLDEINDITVAHNTAIDALRAIDLYAIQNNPVMPYLRNVDVSHNVIHINNADHALLDEIPWGIAIPWTLDGTIDGVTITHNVIRFQADERANAYPSARYGGGINLCQNPTPDGGVVKNVLIQGNVIIDCPIAGIRVDSANADAAGYSNIRILDNVLVNCGRDSIQSSVYRAGIGTDGVLKDVEIARNHAVDTGDPNSEGYYAYYIDADAGSVIRFADDNTIYDAGTDLVNFFANLDGIKGSRDFVTLTYGANIAVEPMKGEVHYLIVTNTSGFTFSEPLPASQGCLGRVLTIVVKRNYVGGVMSLPGWNAAYKLRATAFPGLNNGERYAVSFVYDGTNWLEIWRTETAVAA